MNLSNLHFVGDGRGRRRVLVNGNEIRHVVAADIDKGTVLFHPYPFRLHKIRRGEVYSRSLKGKVEVIFMGDEM